INKILDKLTEEEMQIYKRGRNAKKTTRSKSASVKDYNNSTGFEALIGYLYLTGNIERINEILNEGNEYEG
ncbi:MAG: Mini-ribonuclease 3, partial [Firmicutes bacterium]|nr:Mini-ribonuclease 3 [Candidatus Caballimonas caccae]